MKKWISVIIVICVLLSFTACKSKEEKELERAREAAAAAEEAYWQAQENYDELVRDIERYNQLLDQIENAD